jgi:hypothetical protein
VLAAATTAAACSPQLQDTLLQIDVEGGCPALARATALLVTLDADCCSSQEMRYPLDTPLPGRLGAILPDQAAGKVSVTVAAVDSSGAVLAQAQKDIDLKAGQENDLTLPLDGCDGGPGGFDGPPTVDGSDGGDGPPPVDGCRRRTCAELSRQCGATDNGCGAQLQCGGCGDGQTCSPAGSCDCAEGRTRCGDACADVTSDPEHCGRCDRSCLGGTCTDGRCQPVVVASAVNFPSAVAADDSYVYFSTCGTGTINRVSRGNFSGMPELLASGQGCPVGLTVDAQAIYWASDDGRVIRFTPPATITTVQAQLPANVAGPRPQQLVQDASRLYWVASSPLVGCGTGPFMQSTCGGAILTCNGTGTLTVACNDSSGAATSCTSTTAASVSCLSGVNIVCQNLVAGCNDGTVISAPKAGGTPPSPLYRVQGHTVDLAISGTTLAWASTPQLNLTGTFTAGDTSGVVQRVSAASVPVAVAASQAGVFEADAGQLSIMGQETSGGLTPLATGLIGLATLAADESYVYFGLNDGRIGRIALAEPMAQVEFLTQEQPNPHHLIVDSQAIYWVAGAGTPTAAVYLLAK